MRIRIGNISINYTDNTEIVNNLISAWMKIAKNNETDFKQEEIKAVLLNIPEQDIKWLYDNNDAIYSQYISIGTVPSGVYEISKQSPVLEDLFRNVLFPVKEED